MSELPYTTTVTTIYCRTLNQTYYMQFLWRRLLTRPFIFFYYCPFNVTVFDLIKSSLTFTNIFLSIVLTYSDVMRTRVI